MLLPLLALALGGCATAPAGRQIVWMGQIAEGGQLMPVSVRSWKEKKFDGLVRQQTDFSCGAAVMATIFNEAYGRETTEGQVLVNMLKIADPDVVREKGFSLLDMKNFAQSIGMEAEGYRIDYPTLRGLKVPAIVLLDIRGYKHFVIVRRAWADRVAIGDPALGNHTMTAGEFESAWNGVAFVVLGEGYDPSNSLLDPPAPLSARRLLELHATVPGAETAEFGFGPGNVFSF
jgi:predicted double-glycine peptidase